jgi:hypothetical protein
VLLRRDVPSAVDLWLTLPGETRVESIRALLVNDTERVEISQFRAYLSTHLRGFRPNVIERWPASEIARQAARIRLDDPELACHAIVSLHLNLRRAIQARFFDLTSIRHENGLLRTDLGEPAAPPELLASAARALLAPPPARLDEAFYLVCLESLYPARYPGLIGVVRSALAGLRTQSEDLDAETDSVAGSIDTEVTERSANEDPAAAETEDEFLEARDERRHRHPPPPSSGPLELTALDELLVATIVDSRAGGATAPSEEAVDSSLDELVHLAPRRHASYFHLGFRDAVFERGIAESLHVPNEQRWRWYYAGYISALARETKNSDILSVFDSRPIVHTLGNGKAPAPLVHVQILEALAEHDRHAEAGAFISDLALLRDDGRLAKAMLTRATNLLRVDRVAEARGYLTALDRGLSLRREEYDDVPPPVWAEVRRRLAHCLRYDNNFPAATALLEEILTYPNLESDNRAMVLSDLGLMAAGIRRLADIRLPERHSGVDSLLDSLCLGIERFREAHAQDTQRNAHGCYPLGIIALLEDDFVNAFRLLDEATATFDRRRDRYERGGLLARARFATAIAGLSDARNRERVGSLTGWLMEGLDQGEHVPEHLIDPVVTGLALADENLAVNVTLALLAKQEASALESLASLTLPGSSPVVADALFRRSHAPGRPIPKRFEDLRAALRLYSGAQQQERAEVVLDAMQSLAREGVQEEAFEEVLRDQSLTRGVWDVSDVSDALATLLESQGRYDDASQVLGSIFHRLLSGDGYDREAEAEGILERIQTYPAGYRGIADELASRLEAIHARAEVPAPVAGRPSPVTIYVVGGDERQEQYDAKLRDHFSSTHSGISPVFLHTGWGSNWNVFVDEFERRRATVDGVVVMRFIRTELGRTIRRKWSGPLIGCWGHGFGSLCRVIEAVAVQARRRRID